MKDLLFHHRHRLWSGILFFASLILLIVTELSEYDPKWLNVVVFTPFEKSHMFSDLTGAYFQGNNILDEILVILVILSGLVFGFSRERIEDEFISEIRKNALITAIYLNSLVIILTTLFLFDTQYLIVMQVNLFSTILFFILVYHWKRYRFLKSGHEE